MATASRWTMRIEPYDPDARDADNDGIVQEGTAWERPAGTRLVDELGRAITRGSSSERRPRGLRVVDQQGNSVDYTPTYERPGGGFGAGGGTSMGEVGAPSLREQGLPTIRDLVAGPTPIGPDGKPEKRGTPLSDHGTPALREQGLLSTRQTVTPPPPEVPKPSKPDKAEELNARPGFLPDEIPKNAETRYHGTGERNMEAILKDGLKTNLPGVDENQRKEGVYLTLNINEALDYGTPDTVFAVLVSDDEVDGYDPDTGHSFTTRGIPPSRLRLVTDIEKEKRRMEREQRELAARKRPANWTPPTIDDVDTPDALETFAPDGVLYRFETSDRPDDVRPHVYYFSPDPDYASNYGDRGEVVSELPADFLDIRNPKDRAQMKKAVEESLQSLDKLVESKDPEQQAKYRRARRDVEIALEREDSEQALGQQMAALTLAANAVISPDKPLTPGTGQRMILENLKRDALIDIEGADIEGKGKYSMAFKRRPNTTKYELPKRDGSKETFAVDDMALSPGVTLASADRPELEKPEKPRSPFKPSPPPLEGRAQELADQADGDFKKFMELLDKEGYVVFDYETTGLQDGNIPVQIGAVRIKDGKIVERFNVFTNPQRPLSDWSKENLKDKNGNPLTDEWLGGQMDLAEAHKQLAEFMGDSIIVAHNLPYDGEIIDRMMKDAGIDHKPSGSIDTLMLLRSAVPKGDGDSGPERHTLGALADFFEVDLGDAAHTADADSEAAALVLSKAMNWAEDKDSSPDIFDAAKQKELFDEATKKYNADRKKYEEALKQYQADLADYERAVTRADEPVVETDSPEYRMMHQPSDVGPRAHDLTEDGGEGEWLSDDVYANPDRYTGADKTVVRETMEQLRQARGNPDAKVTIYRWAPEGSSIQDGNWVSLSRTYAEQHGESNAGDVAGSVISLEVPAREVRFAGDDLAEFGWFPEKSDEISKNSGDSPEAPVVDPESVWDIYFPGEAYDRDWLEGQTMENHRRDIRNRLSYFVSRLSDDDRQKLQDEFGTDDLDEIAERLQERVDENIAFAVNDLRKKELHMAVPPEALMAILRERRIRSMFETGTSLGTNDRAVRREVESRLIGVPWETPDELRPIYGFVSGDDEPFALTQGEAARHYGGLVITFKNSKKLRERTTMTAGDSLDYDLHAVPVEGRVSPERLFAASYYNGSTIVQEAIWGVERDVTEEVLGRDYDYPDFGEGEFLNYNEIQIHGGATLDDIEEVVYPPDLDDETRNQIITALDAAGVKHREDW